jgi:hypothetical protein
MIKLPTLPKPPARNYETLDAIAVIYSLTIVAGIIFGLFTFKLEPEVAPIVSSLATAILGIPITYGAFRWGNSVGSKDATDAAAEATKAATGAAVEATKAATATREALAPDNALGGAVEAELTGTVELKPKDDPDA